MSSAYVGEIRIFGGNFAPQGWAACDGTLMQISQYTALYSLIGTTYGGDGQSTFALPDFRSRMPVHPGNGIVYGEVAGSETVTVNTTQLPFHSHSIMGQLNPGNQTTPNGNLWAATGSTSEYSQSVPDSAMNSGTLLPTGAGAAHANIMPYLTLMFIIALDGIYPSH